MQVGIYDDESKRCSFVGCEQVDILAVRCGHCGGIFCCDHTAAGAHRCTAFESRFATCPLCNFPVFPEYTGQLPDEAVSLHIDRGCRSSPSLRNNTGRRNLCSYGDCTKNEFTSIICEGCKRKYCVEHRAPGSHACRAEQIASAVTPPSAPSISNTVAASSKAPLRTSSPFFCTPRNTPTTALGKHTEGVVTPFVVFAPEFNVTPFFMHFPRQIVMGRLLDLVIGQAVLDSADVTTAEGVWVVHVLQQPYNKDGFSLSVPLLSSTLREAGISEDTLVYIGKQQTIPGNILKKLLKLSRRHVTEKSGKKKECNIM